MHKLWVTLSFAIDTGIWLVVMAFIYMGLYSFQFGIVGGSLWVAFCLLIGCTVMALANGELR